MSNQSSRWILGDKLSPNTKDFSEKIAFNDHKIHFAVEHCREKDVLDLGCVQHNPENYKSRFWLHKALAEVSSSLEGLDLYEEGVEYLRQIGYHINVGNAENFDLGKQFDVIVAGDLIEHLGDLRGFLMSCQAHLRPGGKLLVSTPNPWYWRNVVKALLFGTVSNNPEHTLWMCPVTLSQLVSRYDLRLVQWHFGSRYLRDRLMPLPKGVRHAGFHAVIIHSD